MHVSIIINLAQLAMGLKVKAEKAETEGKTCDGGGGL